MKNKIGIMQGRLSNPINNNIQAFPSKTWKDEFGLAEKIGFELIEFVFDSYENPIMTNEGLIEIRNILNNSNVKINSVCADYFMKNLLFNVSENELIQNFKVLNHLIKQCSKLEIGVIELPFVDSASLLPKNKINEIIENLQNSVSTLKEYDMCLALETDLPPNQFFELLDKLNNPYIKANYDIGNSTCNGYNPVIELNTLNEYIINIHIKDRIYQGPTVPLGTGDVNFDLFFSTLSKINYTKDVIIQGAREDIIQKTREPQETCLNYLSFVKKFMMKY